MADSFTFSLDRGFPRAQAGINALYRFTSDLSPVMRGVGHVMQLQVQRTFLAMRDPVTGAAWPKTGQLALSTRPGGGGGGKTLADTGRLLNSLNSSVPRVTKSSVNIGTNLPGAIVHNKPVGQSTTIFPKNSKYLAIPVTREARRTGSARRFIAKTGAKFLFGRRGPWGIGFPAKKRGGDPKVHFILKDKVSIPGRRFLGVGPEYMREIAEFVAGRAMAEVRRHMGT